MATFSPIPSRPETEWFLNKIRRLEEEKRYLQARLANLENSMQNSYAQSMISHDLQQQTRQQGLAQRSEFERILSDKRTSDEYKRRLLGLDPWAETDDRMKAPAVKVPEVKIDKKLSNTLKSLI